MVRLTCLLQTGGMRKLGDFSDFKDGMLAGARLTGFII